MRFHAGFYRARPDVNSVIHTHSHYVSVFATTRRTIGMYNVVSVLFFEDQALYEDDGTHPPVDPDLMCEALGNRRVLLIKNHGAIIVSQSLENATIEACMLEVAARVPDRGRGDRRARSSPTPRRAAAAAKYHKYFLPQMWDANFRRLRKIRPRPLRVRRLMSRRNRMRRARRRRLQPGDGRAHGDDDPRRPRCRRREGRAARR